MSDMQSYHSKRRGTEHLPIRRLVKTEIVLLLQFPKGKTDVYLRYEGHIMQLLHKLVTRFPLPPLETIETLNLPKSFSRAACSGWAA